MSHSTFAARTPTTLYLKPAYASPESGPSDKRIDQLLERASRTASAAPPSLRQSALSRLARESFEAGFAAGAARALAAQGVTDTARALADEQLDTPPHSSPHDLTGEPAASASDHQADLPEPIRALSPRRFQVLELVARGLTNPEIASVLGISANTVKAHLTSILEILDVSNRTEAAMALQEYERQTEARAR
jgi:DNA-binding NarL/FixJ family response regulator